VQTPQSVGRRMKGSWVIAIGRRQSPRWRAGSWDRLLSVFITLGGLALLSALAGCDSEGAAESGEASRAWETYAAQTGVTSWNDALEISVAEDSAPSPGIIDLVVMNRSKYGIRFSPGYGAVILVYSEANKEWTAVANRMTYTGEEEVLVPWESGGGDWLAATSVIPTLDAGEAPAAVRVLIVGRQLQEDGVAGEAVGGYVDAGIPR